MKDIVICLFASGGFDKSAQGLTGAGRLLAEETGGQLRAIVLGKGAEALAAEAAKFADSVLVADHAELDEYQPETYLNAIAQLCREMAPRAVLFSNETYSQEITPRLAHRLGGSAVGDGVEIKAQGDMVRVGRQAYGGKAQALIDLKRSPAVVWLRSRSFTPATARATAGEITRPALAIQVDPRTRIVERKQEDSGQVRLEDARLIVSGGRGIGGQEAFMKELKPLAEILGAQLAATRAACDAGWVPATWQVGITGKKVAPELYLAIGISGATQHLAGISDAKNVVAINTDPEAPIFTYCRFGLVGDYKQMVPLLRQKLAALHK